MNKSATFCEQAIMAQKSCGNTLNLKFVIINKALEEFCYWMIRFWKKTILMRTPSIRCTAMSLLDARSGQFQKVNSLDWKEGDCCTVYLKDMLKDMSFPVKLLKKVFKNEDGTIGILYLVTGDK